MPMKTLLTAAVFLAMAAQGRPAPASRVPVLVELFTSEGCSSCPAADALLESLQREQPIESALIIPVGLHVDYFDHAGWKDAFSSAAFTERQRNYSQKFAGPDSVFTPQIVVNGDEAVVGSEAADVRRAITTAARRSPLPLTFTAQPSADSVRLTIELPAAPGAAEQVQVLAAITQDGLSTVVKAGENGGRTMHHVAVARRLEKIDALGREARVIDKSISMSRKWGSDGLNAVVWLQGSKSRQVYGAAIRPIP
jgi:hypothetical protein